MSQPCSDLISFADGELEPERAHVFRVHLLTCESCRLELVGALQLDVRLVDLPPLPAGVPSKPELPAPGGVVRPHVPGADAPVGGTPGVPADRVPNAQGAAPPIHQLIRRRGCAGRAAVAVGELATVAMAVYLVVATPVVVAPAGNAFAAVRTRPYDVRFAYADVASYRPLASAMRGTATPGDQLSLAGLASLEQRRDLHGLAIGRAWSGYTLNDVSAQLESLEHTPSVRGDLAAIGLLTTDSGNIESVLAELEALKADASPLVSRAARWNYAFLLSRLDLPLSAAQAFREIADEREPGWSGEAADRAKAQAQIGGEARRQWEAANAAGMALVRTGAPVPAEVVAMFPGLMRMHFYNAVRAAPSRERVLALGAIADQLDLLAGQPLMRAYIERVARADFQRRAPIAATYVQLLDRASLDPAAVQKLLAASGDLADIAMGAMIELEVVADHLDAFRTMTRQHPDPWFEAALAMAEATADVGRGDWLGAEARLRDAEKRCESVQYQCFSRALQLGSLYQDLHRVPEAIDVLYPALRAARAAGEWFEYRLLLWRLADVERFHSATATARAYANEYLHMVDGCAKYWAYRIMAGAALLDVDGRAARRYLLEAAPDCGKPDLTAANYLTDIARLDPQPDDLSLLQGWLSALRTGGTLTPAQLVLADEIEGRLLIERDRTAGKALLETAIAAARKLPDDVVADKARVGAYSVLTFDAARQYDYTRVVALIAETLGLAPPGSCAVAMLAEDERSVVVVRGADGKDRGAHDLARGPRAGAPVISGALAAQLAGCERVQVMAQAALQGEPRVLPSNLSWSYATGSRRASASHDREPRAGSTLVVTNVTPPAALELPALAQVPAPPAAMVLSGPGATPAKVLAAMTSATEIQFHTHALVNLGVSDASHLVLSPDQNEHYALTAEAIRGTKLRGHPIIVLAACESAQGARYQHAPWSLPHAFLAAGARAVFAAATKIPDREAGPFFARVLDRVRAGADPGAALRDERMREAPASWVADVILFE
jgi:cellulose synthase operon protein C